MIARRRFHIHHCLACWLVVIMFVHIPGCTSPPAEQSRPEVDEEFERISSAARLAFDHGQNQRALDLYNKALDRAYVLDDLNAIVDSKYNLAVCLTGLGLYDRALKQVNQAQAELARTNQGIPADILLLESNLLHKIGKLDEAWQLTDMILQDASRLSGAVQSKTHFLRGLIASEWEDIKRLRAEISSLGKPSVAGLQADREELVGRLAIAEGNWGGAIDAFDKTAELRRDDFDYSEMVRALALAAWSCEQAGQLSGASKRYLRAGRSAAQQGEKHKASNWLIRSETLAGEAGDDFTAQQARSYRKWLEAP
jgi:tetratricopeptide (TPR) repeat protein